MFKSINREINQIINRGFDRTLRLAVTGLSRSGKTAFITSLINQLLHINQEGNAHLPLFEAARNQSILAVKRVPQQDLSIPRFDYEANLNDLMNNPPQWCQSTRGVSEYSRRRFALPRGRFDRKPVAERQGHRSTIRTADGNSGRRCSLRPYGRHYPGSGIGSRHRTGDPRSETGEGGRRFQNDPLQPLGTRTDRPVRLRTVFRRKTPGLRNFGRRNPQYAQRVGKNYLTA